MNDRTRSPIPSALIAILILFPLAGWGADRPDLQEVLARNIEALGGRDAIAALPGRRIEGREIDDRPYAGPPDTASVVALSDTSGCWMLTVVSGQGTWSEGKDEEGAWTKGLDGEIRPAARPDVKLAFLLDPRGPLRVAEYFPNLRVAGVRTFDGVEYVEVVNDRPATHFALYFEIATGRLGRIGYYWSLEDYREVDGVLVPHAIRRSRKGGSTDLVLDAVVHEGGIIARRDAPAPDGRNR